MRHPAAILAAGLAVSAGPPPDPADAVRQGVRAFAAGRWDEADRRFRAAADRTPDPGLVAFNRGCLAARRGDWATAELAFTQTLEDADCPPRRRAEASYNRGVCLLHRGGPAAVYRTAVDLFADALAGLGDDPLAADARHNRELAKRLWADARTREQVPPRANDPPPDLPPPTLPPNFDPAGEPEGSSGSRPTAGPEVPRPGPPAGGDGRSPGAGGLPVLADADQVQPLTPAEAKAVLDRAADRLARDRKATAALLAGPERPGVRDW